MDLRVDVRRVGDDRFRLLARERIGRLALMLGARDGFGDVGRHELIGDGDGDAKRQPQHGDVVVDGLAGEFAAAGDGGEDVRELERGERQCAQLTTSVVAGRVAPELDGGVVADARGSFDARHVEPLREPALDGGLGARIALCSSLRSRWLFRRFFSRLRHRLVRPWWFQRWLERRADRRRVRRRQSLDRRGALRKVLGHVEGAGFDARADFADEPVGVLDVRRRRRHRHAVDHERGPIAHAVCCEAQANGGRADFYASCCSTGHPARAGIRVPRSTGLLRSCGGWLSRRDR